MTNQNITKLPDSAVFIDGDWLHHATRRLKQEIDYILLRSAINEFFGDKTPIHFYGTVDPQKKDQLKFVQSLENNGYIVTITKIKRKKDRIFRKKLDVKIAVDILSLPAEFSKVVLFSGDSIFVPVLEQVFKNGKLAVPVTVPFAGRQLIHACNNQCMSLEKVLSSVSSGKRLPNIRGSKTVLIPPKNWYVEQGDHFTSYLAVRKLFVSAKLSISVIDPYIDDQILHMITLLPKTISITVLTNKISPADFCIQAIKLRNEGYQLRIYKTTAFHDRFLGIDDQWWHSGHSFKDLGGKDSLITKIEDFDALKKLHKRFDNEITKAKECCI